MTHSPIYDERALLRMVASGDVAAFRMVYDRYRERVYSLGMYLTRSEVHAEEIVQEVFIKVWEQRAKLPEIDYFNSWIRTVARNTVTDILRRMAAERLALDEITVRGRRNEADNSTHDRIADREYARILQDALEKLTPRQREVWLLARERGMRHEDIARELNISTDTSREHMKMALRTIRYHLENEIGLSVLLALACWPQ